ncbi:MAG TPA: hypothetical protein DCR44_02080 [Acholeplasmatales bacterium]|nr:MAG: hypothetical protein A2Y16_03680 [Tenericutes bacterium GWF2_57_13]HAQ56180.1 hypothetical protein [Acholeplasmatales bacterium]
MFRQLWPNRKWLVILSFLLFNVFMTNAALENRVRIVLGEVYDTREEVALYLFNYGELPRNFITKAESNAAFIGYYVAMDRGLNIGGDTSDTKGRSSNGPTRGRLGNATSTPIAKCAIESASSWKNSTIATPA